MSNSIANDIDAIIARAIAEYTGTSLPENITPEPEATPLETPVTIIPENSDSILVEETTSRFSGAVWYDKIKEKEVIIAGCGGIGSYVCYLLSRLHPTHITIYDPDIVEAVNMSGQMYSINDIGKYKVGAMTTMAQNYSDYQNMSALAEAYTNESLTSDIMICGFDNMKARKIFFNKWLDHMKASEHPENCLFIDGRLAAETFQVFCIVGNDTTSIDRYTKEWLFTDAEADATQCSYKQTTFMANMIGSIMVNLFVNFCANQTDVLIPRDVPFMTEYTAETMYFKVIA